MHGKTDYTLYTAYTRARLVHVICIPRESTVVDEHQNTSKIVRVQALSQWLHLYTYACTKEV